MTGDSFCKAAEESFFLMTRNVARLGIVHGLGSLFSLVGEVFISVGTAAFAYFLLNHLQVYIDTVPSPYVPTVVRYLNYSLRALTLIPSSLESSRLLLDLTL